MSKLKNLVNTKSSYFSIIGGVLFLLFLNSNNLFLIDRFINNLFIFISGILYFFWIIFWYKKINDSTKKKIFLSILFFTIILSFYLMNLGNKLGEIEKIIFGFLPFLVILPTYSFIINNKKDLLFRISAVLFILLGVGITIMTDTDRFKFNKLMCDLKKGDFYDNNCRIDNLYTLKKSLFSIAIKIPEERGLYAFLKNRENNNLTGKSISLGVDNGYIGKVTLFSDRVSLIDANTTKHSIIPFVVNHENNKNFYLGLFETTGNSDLNNGEIITHLDSYFIGRDIELGEVTIEKGYYNNFFNQKFTDSKEKTSKEIRLRVGGQLDKFYLDVECEEFGKVEEKFKKDGQKYKVCIFENNNRCELEAYTKGNCPLEGFTITDLITEEEIYCRITGGMLDKKLKKCAFEGYICDLEEYYNGKCD